MGFLGSLFKYLAGAGAGSLFLGYLGIIKPLQYYGRWIVYVLCILVAATYGVGAAVVLSLVGKRGISQWATARCFEFLIGPILGLRFEIENRKILDGNRPAIFVANHQSDLDIGMLGATFPKWCSVTAKKSLRWYPFLGWYMWASGTVFIDRGSRERAIAAFDEAKQVMHQNKQSVFMFPEGTRSHALEPKLLPFKKGAFHFAIQAQVPIVPYVVQNYSHIYSHKRRVIRAGTIKVRALDPVPTAGLTAEDATKLCETVYDKMQKAYIELGLAE